MNSDDLRAHRDPLLAAKLIDRIHGLSRRPMRIMEVCGTHTMSLYRNGIPSLLPPAISLISGPGCPVCVTAQDDIDAIIRLADRKEVVLATFGDLMRVPGSRSSLHRMRAEGKDIRVVYSPVDALDIAAANPAKAVVFAAVGFETTAPLTAAAILTAEARHLDNFYLLCAHKRVIPALEALLSTYRVGVDGFLLPGHVSVVIGADAYRPLVDRFRLPAVISGFEPTDMLHALLLLVTQWENHQYRLENAYPRAVNPQGNPRARSIMETVYEPADVCWRGLGMIPNSGLRLRPAYARHDARTAFDLPVEQSVEPKGCICGDVLTGNKNPAQCALFRNACTPVTPVGPCMVSSEGACAAHYKYHH